MLPPRANLGEGILYGVKIRMNGGYYDSYIQQEHNGSLTRHVVQYIGNEGRILYGLHSALTGSYNKTNGFVDLSMNLADIGYPDQYFISFYVNGTQQLIRTQEREIPTLCHLECVLVQIPPSVTVFPGQQKNVSVIIKPGNASKYLNLMKSTFHETDNLILNTNKAYPKIQVSGNFKSIPVIGEKLYNLTLPKLTHSGIYLISLLEYSNSNNNVNPTPVGVGGINTLHLKLQVSQPPSPPSPPSLTEKLKNFLISQPVITILIPIILTTIICVAILWTVDLNKSAVLHNLTISDVIQVDATVIVGVLILLTLGSAQFNIAGFHRTSLVVGVVTASIVYPFALSAMILTTKGTAEHGIKFTFAGFVYLMVAVLLLSLVQ